MDKYVFISYAHKDKKAVLDSTKALSSCGINLWFDSGIKTGDDWAETIATKLENASLVIVFLSKASSKSKNVLREIEYANAHKIPVLTVQLYKFKLPEKIAKLLTVNQFTMLGSFKTYKSFAENLCPTLEKYGVVGSEKTAYKDKKIPHLGHKLGKTILSIILVLIILAILIIKFLIADVPTVLGMETNPAEVSVVKSGFECAVANGYSDEEEYGYIFDQSKVGAGIKNSTVVISQSLGPEVDLVDVPSVVGFHISEGVAKLVDVGMTTFIIEPIETNEYDIAYIASQSISPNFKVSSHSKIALGVSSDADTIIEFYGQKIKLTDKKLEVQILDNKEVKITPLMVYGISADYTETDPLNEAGTVNSTSRFLINIKREDTNYYGKYRGRFVMDISLTGDDSLAWKILRKTSGDKNGKINLQVKSESFACTAEEYSDSKYKQFVEEVTGSQLNAVTFTEPIMMVLGKEIVLTDMSPLAKNLDWLYSVTSRFVFSIPELKNDVLIQPYSIIVQRNGKAYVVFYSRDGEQKTMKFHGDLIHE
ncbi:MAG: TIR domain-containing protein [Bacillota bacterium]|nr:TIR domain-containing protein [Bacillota bacterium]